MSIITLNNSHNSCKISTLGGQVLSCNILGTDIFYTTDNPRRSGIPLLFPFAGALDGGVFKKKFGKKTDKEVAEIKFPQHGFARDCEFEVLDSEVDSISLVLASDMLSSEIRAMYPYKFMLCVDYELLEDSLVMTIEVTSFESELPIAPGIHPYFPTTLELNSDLGDSRVVESASSEVFEYCDYELTNGKVVVNITDNGNASNLVVWSDSPDYNCIEPWCRDFDGINIDPIIIPANSQWNWEVVFSVDIL
jgi:galactose mutarotase-like enzyme